MKGEGLLLRDPGKLPPSARKQLEKVGDEKITSIKLSRTPLSSTTKAFLNIISLGQFEKISKQYFDDLFHLAMWINGKYNLEKDEVIKFGTKNPIKSNSETRDVSVNKNITFNELFENTRKYMGDDKFTSYTAETNNCQNFLVSILNANGIGTEEDKKWIKQDTDEVFKKVPTFAKVLGNLATTAGAVVNRLVEGEGRPRRLYQEKDGRYYYMQNGKKRYVKGEEGMTQQQIVRINLGELVKPKKKRKRRKRKKALVPQQRLGFIAGMPPPVVVQTRPAAAAPSQPAQAQVPSQKEELKLLEYIDKLQLLDRKPTEIPKPVPKMEGAPISEVGSYIPEDPVRRAIYFYFNPPGSEMSYKGLQLDPEESKDLRLKTFLTRYYSNLSEDARKIRMTEDMKDPEIKKYWNEQFKQFKEEMEALTTRSGTVRTEYRDLFGDFKRKTESENQTETTSATSSTRSSSSEESKSNVVRGETKDEEPLLALPSKPATGVNLVDLINISGENKTPAQVRQFRQNMRSQLMPSLRYPVNTNTPSSFSSATSGTQDLGSPPAETISMKRFGVLPPINRNSSGTGIEVPAENTCPPCNIYTALNLGLSGLPIGMANNNPLIKTDGLTGATTSSTAPATTAPETKKDEPQQPDKVQGKGLFSNVVGLANPFLGIAARTLGYGYGLVGGCHGMDMCQCGGADSESYQSSSETVSSIESDPEAHARLPHSTRSFIHYKRTLKREVKRLESLIRENLRVTNRTDETRSNMTRLLRSYRNAYNTLYENVDDDDPLMSDVLSYNDIRTLIRNHRFGSGKLFSKPKISDAEWRRTERLIEATQSDVDSLMKFIPRDRVKLFPEPIPDEPEAIQKRLNAIEDAQSKMAEMKFEHPKFSGKGDDESVDGLYNDEIEKIADRMGYDIPVIALDEMDEVVKMINPKTKEFGFIINVVPSSSDGSGTDGYRSGHWRAVYINNEDDLPSIEFFDPLGDAPEPHLIDGFRKIADKIDSDKLMLFKENMVKRQANDTNTCGHFALKFLEDRFNGVPWTEATGYDKCNQSQEGEREIQKSVKKYEGYL